ncbi:MAG: sulfite exporter TauE/SafE family protein [Woeseiaceae bacterium]|nr:sulfite exporter TauE/SafE family protein [Woeseiaceae bacterium]
MPEADAIFIALVIGSFVASVCNAAFSVGGALIILATTSAVLPISAVVPIHSTLLIGSTATRVLLFWEHINWNIARPFLLASGFGAYFGAKLYFGLPEQFVAIAIAVLMLVAIWLPGVSWRPKLKHPWLIVGFAHSFLSTAFAYGAILQSIILHTGLKRREIVGTIGGCLTGMAVFKIASYVLNGFNYVPYLATILAAIVVSFFGTWIGRKLVDRISEKAFRLVFRVLITLTAIRLIYANLT